MRNKRMLCFLVMTWVWPPPVIVTTRIITFFIGNPYNPSFTTVTVRGPYPSDDPYILPS